jgi:hypothetical protein
MTSGAARLAKAAGLRDPFNRGAGHAERRSYVSDPAAFSCFVNALKSVGAQEKHLGTF